MTNHQLLQARIAVLLEIILCQHNMQLFCIMPGLRSENESACYTQSASAAHSSASLGQHLALLSASRSRHNEHITVRGSHNSRSQDQMPYCYNINCTIITSKTSLFSPIVCYLVLLVGLSDSRTSHKSDISLC